MILFHVLNEQIILIIDTVPMPSGSRLGFSIKTLAEKLGYAVDPLDAAKFLSIDMQEEDSVKLM